MNLTPDFLLCGLVAVFGLSVGSFLNVLIHRLPIMLQRHWEAECATSTQQLDTPAATFNLWRPVSHCPHCQTPLVWYHNIPVLSYLVLHGHCADCQQPIHWRYPLVELVTAVLFVAIWLRYGYSTQTPLAWAMISTLLALAGIDWHTTLLPDDLTLPLLWAGLLAANLHWTNAPPSAAIGGAAIGYLSLWLVFWIFKLITGQIGMGYGDFKLFAALGAWFGWSALLPMILIASVSGTIIGLALKVRGHLGAEHYIPFGPFLALAGIWAWFWQPETFWLWMKSL